jgi:hypothetical protein
LRRDPLLDTACRDPTVGGDVFQLTEDGKLGLAIVVGTPFASLAHPWETRSPALNGGRATPYRAAPDKPGCAPPLATGGVAVLRLIDLYVIEDTS